VKPDQSVEVRAPKRVSKRDVESFLREKERWVISKLNEFSLRPDPHELIYEEGGKHYFLGESHRIVDASKTARGSQLHLALDLDEATIPLNALQNATAEQVERKLDRWYRKEALDLFTERHGYWREEMARFDLPDSHVTVRKMKRRWGSCTTKGKITFSTTLAKYPINCVDAVVVHELCHLLEFSHNKRFYRFMSQVYPNWKESDKLLNNLSLLY